MSTIASEDPLLTPVQFVRGVGPARADLLARLNLLTAGDLLFDLPRDVLDLTRVVPVFELKPDTVQTVFGIVVDRDAKETSNGKTITAVLLQSDGGFVRGVWFNQPYMLRRFEHGQRVLFSGKPKFSQRRWEFSHPHIQFLGDDEGDVTGGLLPRYGLTEGLRQHELRRVMRNVVEDYVHLIPEMLPESFRQRALVPEIKQALTQIHLPKSMEEYEGARRRLLFDDLLEFQLGLALRRRMWQKTQRATPLPNSAKVDARIRRRFSFRFTAGQDHAVQEIVADLARDRAMHRLLQADVGAGKTAVAVYAMLVSIAAGHQAVLMAPTEVLAQQHWQTIDTLLQESRVERRILTGQLTAANRRETLEGIETGNVQMVIGTQALIQASVKFHSLGLAVIDEQHKFGVMQRARFSEGGISPHVLVMTATPIPRSLCLTQFGDLDLTVINELPPGRQRVVTSRIHGQAAARKVWDFIRERLREGRQAYIVCPRVEEDASLPAGVESTASAEAVFRDVSAGILKEFRVGLVHGQQSRDDRSTAMTAFRNGDLDVIVATTVIEVGVDVPNATMMIVHQAERFGLSQLHQLRGRIGRGRFQGYCFLFSEAESSEAVARLSAMESTSDGFRIAEVDFELRGPGDVLGTRQSGSLPLRLADLVRDKALLEEARVAAFNLVESGEFDQPEFAMLKIRVLERFAKLMDLQQTG
ncbi:MAG: ATP-dependent DNA helicase RecG [Planctomycetes bacterium]|nr:ATP-dependent DNA helicase RecG [Planctomycetota bacterium]